MEQTLEGYAAPLGKSYLANGQSVAWRGRRGGDLMGFTRHICIYMRNYIATCKASLESSSELVEAEAVAEKVLSEQQSQLGKPVSFELRLAEVVHKPSMAYMDRRYVDMTHIAHI